MGDLATAQHLLQKEKAGVAKIITLGPLKPRLQDTPILYAITIGRGPGAEFWAEFHAQHTSSQLTGSHCCA